MQSGLSLSRAHFFRRVWASLGTREGFRTENWLAVTRVVLALCCYTWIRWEAKGLAQQMGHGQMLLETYLGAYVVYSFLALVLLHLIGRTRSTAYSVTTQIIDVFVGAAITVLTGPVESPSWMLGVFAVVSAAYRWGLPQIWQTSAAWALLLLVDAIVLQFWVQHFADASEAGLEIDRIVGRGSFSLVAGLVLGWLAVRERRLRAESALLVRILSRAHVNGEADQALEALFADIVRLYLPRKASIALRRENVEEILSWEPEARLDQLHTGRVRTILKFSKLEAVAFSLPAHTWYFAQDERHPDRAPHFRALDALGSGVRRLHSHDLQTCLPASKVSSLMVSSLDFGEGWNGRLILYGPSVQRDSKHALRFLQRVVKQIGPAMTNICLLRDIRNQIEDQVLARLTHELHDGTIQSLLGAVMQIDVLRRQNQGLFGETEQRLAVVQSLLLREVANLRDLIEDTKPLNFSPNELPDFLAELVGKFRRETDISVRLECGEENINLPPAVCHEIVRIVQEGLSNARKHSGARNVLVTMCRTNDGKHKLLIADDGRGFGFHGRVTQTQLDASHRGPGVIKERVRLIGGELTIDTFPGHGARLEITIPDESHG